MWIWSIVITAQAISKKKCNEKMKWFSDLNFLMMNKCTFPAAFLYRRVASWINSRTSNSPSLHGTTTRTFPKHTVTFMFELYSSSSSFFFSSSSLNKCFVLEICSLHEFYFCYIVAKESQFIQSHFKICLPLKFKQISYLNMIRLVISACICPWISHFLFFFVVFVKFTPYSTSHSHLFTYYSRFITIAYTFFSSSPSYTMNRLH